MIDELLEYIEEKLVDDVSDAPCDICKAPIIMGEAVFLNRDNQYVHWNCFHDKLAEEC